MIIYSPSVSVLLIVLIVASIIGEGKEIILKSGINLIISVMTLHLLGFILGYIISFVLAPRHLGGVGALLVRIKNKFKKFNY